jgi:hypothetical protein
MKFDYSWTLSFEENCLSFESEILTKCRSEMVPVTKLKSIPALTLNALSRMSVPSDWKTSSWSPVPSCQLRQESNPNDFGAFLDRISVSSRGHNNISIPPRSLWASITPNSMVLGIDTPSKQWWTPTLLSFSQRCLALTSSHQCWLCIRGCRPPPPSTRRDGR